ncbi:MAG: GYD domain-containing protein [Endomicrobia bacterium]|nr:GYD domain-containing protein [Endomicrobiia bacterium]MCX7941001.1 GYD domain-containing protein [Endomicrobiia bacterium]MDW8055426.1 GYD domain-containing protein [Elusimicrobiota bacterium]
MKYVMLGKYSVEAIRNISKQRTEEVKKIISNNKGRVEAMYVLLGPYDLIFIVNFPSEKEAIKTSVELTKLTGIGFTTMPTITVAEFDRFVG